MAIVSAIPGTTRDALEARIVLGGAPATLIDTAGLRETQDPLERLGIEVEREGFETVEAFRVLRTNLIVLEAAGRPRTVAVVAATQDAGKTFVSVNLAQSASALDDKVAPELMRERLAECTDLQEPITEASRMALLETEVEVLIDGVDEDGDAFGRTYREAPEIDGMVQVADTLAVGEFHDVRIVQVFGPDLIAEGAGLVE